MIDQHPVIPPPALQCDRDTEREDHPDGGGRGGRKGVRPSHSSTSVSPFGAKTHAGWSTAPNKNDQSAAVTPRL
jgi:hypothetical protein